MSKLSILKILMRLIALVMGVGFGLSHLFFPGRYFGRFGQSNFDGTDVFQLFLAGTTGVLVVALCVGLWIAASDPVRYRVVGIMFVLAGAMMALLFFYHLAFTHAIGGWEWLNLIAVGAVTYAVYALYPWSDKQG